MKTTAPSRLARLTRSALPAAPLVLVSIPAAKAQIVYTSANITMAAGDHEFIYVDMGTGGAQGAAVLCPPAWQAPYTIPISSPSFYLFFRDWNPGKPEWASNSNVNFDGDNQVSQTGQGSTITKLNYGATIDGSLTLGGNYAAFAGTYSVNTPWTPGTTGYIGVLFDTNITPLYGWAQISYNADQTLTLLGFAYNATPGAAILAGTLIPEPSTTAALAGLLAGSAALFRRRSRLQTAA